MPFRFNTLTSITELLPPHDLTRSVNAMGSLFLYKSNIISINEVRIEKIAEILGHSDLNTTKLYLGINLDDMSKALEQGANYRQNMGGVINRQIRTPDRVEPVV